MTQAIQTKFIGPGNVRGSRIVAKCDAKRIVVSWDYALNPGDNHRAAAKKLILQLGWYGHWVQGSLPDGTDCFVCSKREPGMHEGFDVWENMMAEVA